MIESTLTSRGQTTLPKEVRDALGLKPGDRVRYRFEGGAVRLVKAGPVARLRGGAGYEGPPRSLEQMQEAIAAAAAGERE